MKTITKEELKNILFSQKGTTFISLETETEQKLKGGKKNPLSGLIKINKVCGAIGFHYQNSVNRQKEREGQESNFISQPRKWGVRLNGTPLVQNGEKFYLELKVQSSQTPDYFFKGVRIDNEQVRKFLPNKSSSRQNLENEVILRDYSLDSIKRIKINSEEYSIYG